VSRLSWFPFYVDDFIGGTLNMTSAEVGQYILLLCAQWSSKDRQSMPSDRAQLTIICKGVPPSAVVMKKFEGVGSDSDQEGGLRNNRLFSEWSKAREQHSAKSRGGRLRQGLHGDGDGGLPRIGGTRNINKDVRVEILSRDEFQCCRCGSSDGLTIDHILPRIVGGTSVPGNLRVLCKSCNSSRPTAGQALVEDLKQDGYSLAAMLKLCSSSGVAELDTTTTTTTTTTTKNKKQRTATTKTDLPPSAASPDGSEGSGWQTQAADDWIAEYGGSPPKQFFGAVKPVVRKHGWERVRPVLRFFLGETDIEFLNMAKFAGGFGQWESRMTGSGRSRASPKVREQEAGFAAFMVGGNGESRLLGPGTGVVASQPPAEGREQGGAGASRGNVPGGAGPSDG
jgi:uncharacterized protein YdaU (DUF1376 family)